MKALTIVLGILMVIGGFFCIFDTVATFTILGWIIGFAAFISGIGLITSYINANKTGIASGWTILGGVVSLIIGLFILFSARARFFTDAVLAYTISIWAVIFGIVCIIVAFKIKSFRKTLVPESRGHLWLITLIIGILTVLLGIYACIHPLVTVVNVGIMVGLSILFTGIDTICMGAMMPGKREHNSGDN